MHQALKNTISFSLASGESITALHGLALSGSNELRPVSPDIVFIPSPDLLVETTLTEITLTNSSGVLLTGTVLVEYWHTIERVFPDAGENLPTRPIIVVSAESGNQPPIPPFALSEVIIFANVDGDDDEGTGTEDEPYRTFQRAVRDVPPFIPPGVHYVIDITNLGDETLPEGYELPAWSSTDFVFNGPGIEIRATMKPAEALTPTQRVFTATATSQNPVTKLWSVEDASQAWPALTGLYLEQGDPDDPRIGVIHDNNLTIIDVTGEDPLFVDELRIVEPSARLLGDFLVSAHANVNFVGVYIDRVTVIDTQCIMDHCTVKDSYFASPVYRHYTFNCQLVNVGWGGQFYCSGSLVRGLSAEAFEPAPPYMFFRAGCVLKDIGTISPIHLGEDRKFSTQLLLTDSLIDGVSGDGLVLLGGVAYIENVQIDNCQGNAFSFKGPGKYIMGNVAGTGSTGVGVFSTDGAQVECTTKTGTGDSLEAFPDPEFGVVMVLTKVGAGFTGGNSITIALAPTPANNGTFQVLGPIDADNLAYVNPNGVTEAAPIATWIIDPVTVTGADDQKVGDLAAGAWPVVTGVSAAFNIVDFFGGVNPNATGTGARLFNK